MEAVPALFTVLRNNFNYRYPLQNLGFVHLSAGDLLRAERARKGSQYGELIEGHIRNGTIVPVEITCSLLENVINWQIIMQVVQLLLIFRYSLCDVLQKSWEAQLSKWI